MMKIAVAAQGGQVAGHFGGCEQFEFFTVDDKGQVTQHEVVKNPGHDNAKGPLPALVAGLGAQAIIAGGMGAGARENFEGRGLQVITGAAGPAEDAALALARGELADAGKSCAGHSHGGQGGCGGHHHHHGEGHVCRCRQG